MPTMPDKGKKSLFRLVFSRTFLLISLMLIQLGLLLVCYRLLAQHYIWIYGALTVFSAVLVVYIVNKPGNPAIKISWIVPHHRLSGIRRAAVPVY